MPTCPRCGAIPAAGARFCVACGTPIAAPATAPAPAAYPPPPASWPAPTAPLTHSRMPARLGLLAIVATVVASAAIWQVSNSGSADTNTLPPATTPLSGDVVVGPPQEIGSETSEPGQATTLRVPAGEPLAGMTISVPGDAYDAATAFSVSVRDLQVNGYGGAIAALTDLIVVENGGAYSAAPMTVTIPVALPAGAFAMGLYLGDDGSLEPMPLVGETSSSVTVLTRHFSRFFIAVIAEEALPENIGTGFRAGEDDIQTPNYGSYIEFRGHCAGQSLAEMWYFEERRAAGAKPLWGLTDNNGKGTTPGFWPDDSYAYRLSSSIHHELDWETLSGTILLAFEKAKVDQLQWDAFRYAMLITGQPQFVGLSVGDDPGGHVVVAYAATRTGLWVADPNYPGTLRDIAWDGNAKAFRPYDSGADAASSEEHYDRIAFYGKTALVGWDQIGARWAQVDDGSIGTGLFPSPALYIQITNPDGTTAWSPMTDGPLATSQPVLSLVSPSVAISMQASFWDGTDWLATIVSTPGTSWQVSLRDGISDLGVYFRAKNPADAKAEWRAVDFYRFKVSVLPPASLAPATPLSTPTPAPPTARPSTAPTPTPVATPADTFACGPRPSDLEGGLDWDLHCQGIQP
jgi:hypothetical protein